MDHYPALLVEAFTAEPLQGNGAGVVLLEHPATAAWMQAVAASLRQSETAFLWCDHAGCWRLRWFTPTCEVPLCGHATLAATLGLAHWGLLPVGSALRLASRSGGLPVAVRAGQPSDDGLQTSAQVSLTLPSGPLIPDPSPRPELTPLLGEPPQACWGSAIGYRVVLMADDYPLAQLTMDSASLQGEERNGLVVMQAAQGPNPTVAGQPCDYQLRFFAPGLGIDEDPVTGSAHALVAPWWMERLQRSTVRGWQPSWRRGGMLCEAVNPGFVRLSGTGHLLWDGQIHAPGCGHDGKAWDVCSSS
jgi:PhzF family phenazine biosynthesis protein